MSLLGRFQWYMSLEKYWLLEVHRPQVTNNSTRPWLSYVATLLSLEAIR